MLLDYLGWALNVITNILLRSLKKFSDYSNLTIKPKKKKKKSIHTSYLRTEDSIILGGKTTSSLLFIGYLEHEVCQQRLKGRNKRCYFNTSLKGEKANCIYAHDFLQPTHNKLNIFQKKERRRQREI